MTVSEMTAAQVAEALRLRAATVFSKHLQALMLRAAELLELSQDDNK